MKNSGFIGLGVEKAATSWIFACLYEHPEVCIPVKEVNFFSNEELWQKGIKWYEAFYEERCNDQQLIKGEFSTSYFYHPKVAQRIFENYPDIKLIVNLRNPVERAYSNYINDIKAGTIDSELSFEEALKNQDYYIRQGHYKEQLERYMGLFKKSQMLVMVYDDLKDPLDFIQKIYAFLQVDQNFEPQVLYKKINTARLPGNLPVEIWNNRIAAALQKSRIGEKIWWKIKTSGIPEWIRNLNTVKNEDKAISENTYSKLRIEFEEDIRFIEEFLERKLDW